MALLKQYTIEVMQRGDHAAVHTYTTRAWAYHRQSVDGGQLFTFTANDKGIQAVQAELFVSAQDSVFISHVDAF